MAPIKVISLLVAVALIIRAIAAITHRDKLIWAACAPLVCCLVYTMANFSAIVI